MVKQIYNKIKNSIWLYPAIYSLGSLLLSVAISYLDRHYSDVIAIQFQGLFYTTSSLAQAVLGIIAGAFITIATFTFSTAMVVLTMYSSQFTPRVVENFLNNQTTMKSFGVFLSGFIYAITSLLLINSNKDGNLVIAASVGVLYVIVGLVYFLLFIHNVSTHIQASGLILRLHGKASSEISEYSEFVSQSEIISAGQLQQITSQKNKIDLFGLKDGYIQELNYTRLQRIAQNNDFIICFRKVTGQFISTETRIITVYYSGSEELDKSVINEIRQCVFVGNKRTEHQDFSFTIQKIVEIAIKALSPGINDPHTAVHCLNIIGLLMRDLADIQDGYVVLKEEEKDGFVVYEAFDFDFLLYDAYNQIILYGQSDASVMIAVFKSLRFAKARASNENSQAIDEYALRLSEKLKDNGFDKFDYSKIDNEYKDLLIS